VSDRLAVVAEAVALAKMMAEGGGCDGDILGEIRHGDFPLDASHRSNKMEN
jgi:hypothetical protein